MSGSWSKLNLWPVTQQLKNFRLQICLWLGHLIGIQIPRLGLPHDLPIICICQPCILNLNDLTALKLTFRQLCLFICFFESAAEKLECSCRSWLGWWSLYHLQFTSTAAFADLSCIVRAHLFFYSSDHRESPPDGHFRTSMMQLNINLTKRLWCMNLKWSLGK